MIWFYLLCILFVMALILSFFFYKDRRQSDHKQVWRILLVSVGIAMAFAWFQTPQDNFQFYSGLALLLIGTAPVFIILYRMNKNKWW